MVDEQGSPTVPAGRELFRRAVQLLRLDARLGGLLIVGCRGSGKSALLDEACRELAIDDYIRVGPFTDHRHVQGRGLAVAHHWEKLDSTLRYVCHQSERLVAAADELPSGSERFAMAVYLPSDEDADARMTVLDGAFVTPREAGNGQNAGEVIAASEVAMSRAHVRQLSEAANQLEVEGNHADYLAMVAAAANAALRGRRWTDAEDLALATALVLLPRERRRRSESGGVQGDDRLNSPPESDRAGGREPVELPLDIDLPEQASGSTDKLPDPTRIDTGADVAGSIPAPGSVDPDDGARLLVEAAHAVWPLAPRSIGDHPRGRASGTRGRFIRAMPARRARRAPIALAATVQAALPWQTVRGRGTTGRLKVLPRDLRAKQFAPPRRTLHVVVVDASGSMAGKQLSHVKGAVHDLLRRVYSSRDQVALIAFQGRSAEVILKPSRGLGPAMRAIDQLPAGGGTPLAAGIARAVEMALVEKRADPDLRVHLTVLTDGRSRGALASGLGVQVAALCESITVVDPSPVHTAMGDAPELARLLGAAFQRLAPIDRSGTL